MRPTDPLLGPQAIRTLRPDSGVVSQAQETVARHFAGELCGEPDHGYIGPVQSSCRSALTLRMRLPCGTGLAGDRD
ncbi:MAG: hypothetical protein LBT40_15750 [Deltaproteobacteria bacterium]|jgi:hypothetical protein|nr:hypothetical protein [Deltaproteobacteria bacterium]